MSNSECIIKNKKYEHLNLTERKIIKSMLKDKKSMGEIAETLRRNISTIRREIKRGTVVEYKAATYLSKKPDYPTHITREVYYAEEGQRVYEEHKKNCRYKGKLEKCIQFVRFVEDRILEYKLSIDAAIGYARLNNLFSGQIVCTKTFYSWVEKGLLNVNVFNLFNKISRKPRKSSNKSNKHKKKLGKSIDDRPAIVKTREEFGHWEGDLIVGKDNKSYLFSLVERKTRIGLLFKVSSKERKHVVDILDILETKYEKETFKKLFKSITFDNGSEFSDSEGMEKDGRLSVYYAHPYSSYERGSNENWNGLVRRYLPKGSCFKDLKDEDIDGIVHRINTIPRKKLEYRTSLDLWKEEINAILKA